MGKSSSHLAKKTNMVTNPQSSWNSDRPGRNVAPSIEGAIQVDVQALRRVERNLTSSRKHVLDAYSRSKEGRTEEEAKKRLDACEHALSDKQHKNIRSELVNLDLLRDLNPGQRGPVKHRWVRTSELDFIFKPAAPGGTAPPEPRTGKSSKLAELVLERIFETIEHMDKNDSWRKPRQVRRICLDELLPVLQHISDLNDQGFHLTTAHGFFTKEDPPTYRWIFGDLDLRGPLGVPTQDTDVRVDSEHRMPAIITKGFKSADIDASGNVFPGSVDAISTVDESSIRMLETTPIVIGKPRSVEVADNRRRILEKARPRDWRKYPARVDTGLIYPSLLEWREYLSLVSDELGKLGAGETVERIA